jgi:signal transduction histidine kinase/ActR/RegA family two-component response regulator
LAAWFERFIEPVLSRQVPMLQMVMLFSALALILLLYNVRTLRRVLNEMKREINISSLISRLLGYPGGRFLKGGTSEDLMQNVADTLAQGLGLGMAFVFRLDAETGTLRVSGFSPRRTIADLAAEILQVLPLQDQVLRVPMNTRGMRTAVEGDAYICDAVDEIFGADNETSAAFEKLAKKLNLRLFFLSILFVDTKAVAAIFCGSAKKGFATDQLLFLERVRQFGAMILEGVLRREEQQVYLQSLSAKESRLRALNEIARSINSRLDIRSIIQGALAGLERLFPDIPITVLTREPDKDELRLAGLNTTATITASQVGLKHSAVFTTTDFPDEDVLRKKRFLVAPPAPIASALSPFSPLLLYSIDTEERWMGILCVGTSTGDQMSVEDQEFFSFFADHLAVALQNANISEGIKEAYSKLKMSQETQIRQEQLRVLGQMASGVTHDINNMLTPILVYAEQVLKHKVLPPEVQGDVLSIQNAALEIANVVQRIQDFYRTAPSAPGTVSIEKVVRDAVELTEPRWKSMPEQTGRRINMTVSTERNLPPLHGSETDLRQAVVNLILNGVEAMPNGGQLTVTARALDPAAVSSAIIYEIYNAEGKMPTAFIAIEVTDTGVGMDEETRRRCVEPFFTTKEATGSGLGLSIAHAATKRHHGHFEVGSTPGQGSTFRVLLPAFGDEEPAGAVKEDLIRLPPLRILLVDDEAPILKSVSDMLKRSGHMVQVAMGGQTALRLLQEFAEKDAPMDVVVTDLGMPEMDGRAVARAVKAFRPNLPVVLLTGWGRGADLVSSLPPDVDTVVEKPVTEKALLSALARVHRPAKPPRIIP